MWNEKLSPQELERRIEAFARREALRFLNSFKPEALEIMRASNDPDPETTVVRKALRRANAAREALDFPPVERLQRALNTWIPDMEAQKPLPNEDAEDFQLRLEMDQMVLARLRGIQEAMDQGDLDLAFTRLREARISRPEDKHPIGCALSEVFDVDSAFWLDLFSPN
jgi:hypothetical protein